MWTMDVVSAAEETGLEVTHFGDDPEISGRRAAPPPLADQMLALQRLTRAFVDSPANILQELVNVAVQLCGADSAGISLEREDRTDERSLPLGCDRR